MNPQLFLYEQLQLLSMKDDSGLVHSYDAVNQGVYASGGAVLMDLLMLGCITIGVNNLCTALPNRPTPTDEVLAKALSRIEKAKKPKDAKYWVLIFSTYDTPYRKAVKHLIAKEVVGLEKKKTWVFFTKTRYPLHNTALKQSLIKKLETAIEPESSPDIETLTLLGLVKSAKLLPYIFPEHFRDNPNELTAKVEEALKKKPQDNFVEGALEDDRKRQEMFEALEMSLDALAIALDVIGDAVDSSIGDAGGDGGDGGGDGGGGGSD